MTMKKTNVSSRAIPIAATQTEHAQSSQLSGQMFGLAATAVFVVMLILNAISY
jgi:hypothetical protein